MPIENLEAKLDQMDSAFKSAPSDFGGYELPEPGDYQATFTAVDFFEGKQPPNVPYLKLSFTVEFDPLYAGRSIDVIHPLVPDGPSDFVEMKMSFLKKDLKTLGVPVEDEDFSFNQVRPGSAIWDGLLDAQFELAIRDSKKANPNTGKPYRNAYINQRIGDPLPKQERLQAQSDIPASADDMKPLPTGGEDGESIPFAWRGRRWDDKYHGWSRF